MLFRSLTAAGIHMTAHGGLPEYTIRLGTWIEPSKFMCTDGLAQLLRSENAVAIFGSSELRHGQNTEFGVNSVFKDSDMDPVCIGQAGYQSLTHAITAGALGEALSEKKAVIIVSPQWFKDGGVKKSAFGASFSEDAFLTFLKNDKIGRETKRYVTERARELASDNCALLEKIETDIKLYGGEDQKESLGRWREFLVKERTDTGLFLKSVVSNRARKEERRQREIDWNALYKQAKENGKKIADNNEYGMLDAVYEKEYRDLIEKGGVKKPAYCVDSKEFEDLECFLQVCGDNGIDVLVVMLPFNGYWYDYLELEQKERSALYDRTKELAEAFGASYADLSSNEYEPYYFEDNSHPALKGLVDMNEQIYRFYKALEK